MIYVIAWLFPPLALLLVGKPFQAMLNGVLWIVGVVLSMGVIGLFIVIPCIIWACAGVAVARGDKKHQQMLDTIAATRR